MEENVNICPECGGDKSEWVNEGDDGFWQCPCQEVDLDQEIADFYEGNGYFWDDDDDEMNADPAFSLSYP